MFALGVPQALAPASLVAAPLPLPLLDPELVPPLPDPELLPALPDPEPLPELLFPLEPLLELLFPPEPLPELLFPPEPLPELLFPPEPLPELLFPPEPLPELLFPPEPLPELLFPPEPLPELLFPPEPLPELLFPPELLPLLLSPVPSPAPGLGLLEQATAMGNIGRTRMAARIQTRTRERRIDKASSANKLWDPTAVPRNAGCGTTAACIGRRWGSRRLAENGATSVEEEIFSASAARLRDRERPANETTRRCGAPLRGALLRLREAERALRSALGDAGRTLRSIVDSVDRAHRVVAQLFVQRPLRRGQTRLEEEVKLQDGPLVVNRPKRPHDVEVVDVSLAREHSPFDDVDAGRHRFRRREPRDVPEHHHAVHDRDLDVDVGRAVGTVTDDARRPEFSGSKSL